MSINLSVPGNPNPELKPRITVIGIGGAGGNAVNNMIEAKLEGVDFVVANTDAQALTLARTDRRIQLGHETTKGLGAGSRPEVGRAAAEEAMDQILDHIRGSHMVFIAAGMGGGTGTGAAPVIAACAREQGILTVGVVTKPFQFEGAHRMRIADGGIEEMQRQVDTLIVIPNQNLFRVANEKTTFADAFKMADDVLYSGVRSVTDLMVMPGLINLDFADVQAVMSEMGKAMMGTGEAEGDNRAKDAAESAIANPLLEDTSVKGARGVLINITGGADMTLFEVDEAANRIRDEVDPDARIIFGSAFDASLDGRIRVSVVATGIDAQNAVRPEPVVLRPAKDLSATVKTASSGIFQLVTEAASGGGEAVAAEPAAEEEVASIVERVEAAAHAPLGIDAINEDEGMEPVVADEPKVAVVQKVAETVADAAPADVYIPPMPAAADGRAAPAPNVDPFAEAAMRNGAAAEASKVRKGGPSLFHRVTGLGARLGGGEPTAAVSDGGQVRGGQAQAVKAAELPLAKPSPLDRTITSKDDDDLLDIPAFLRRQAN